MTTEGLVRYAAQKTGASVIVERPKPRVVILRFEARRLTAEMINNLVNSCGASPHFQIHLIDGQLALEMHIPKSSRIKERRRQKRHDAKESQKTAAKAKKLQQRFVEKVQKICGKPIKEVSDDLQKELENWNPALPGIPELEDLPGIPELEDLLEDLPGIPELEDLPGIPELEDLPGIPELEDLPGLPEI